MNIIILSISNTLRGSFDKRLGEFVADEDRLGKPIYSDANLRINTDPKSVCPSVLSAEQITKLVEFALSKGTNVQTTSGVSYELHRKEILDETVDESTGVAKPPATAWYYRPERQPMGKFAL